MSEWDERFKSLQRRFRERIDQTTPKGDPIGYAEPVEFALIRDARDLAREALAQLAQRDAELEALREKVVKVAAMHEPRPKSSRERGALPQGCSCGAHYWPCPTVAALSDNQEGRDD